MTQIAFHFNAPDKLGYVCRFVRKALRHDARVTVLGSEAMLRQLSPRLWKASPQDFLAHAVQGSDASLMAQSPVALVHTLAASPHHDILLNLDAQVPEGYSAFARVVEVVSAFDEMDKDQARQRWRRYTQDGHTIVRHDLVLQES